jgi:hypothetical protein
VWCDRIEDRRAGIPIPTRPRTARDLDLAKAQLEPLLSRGIVTEEVRSLAAEFASLNPNFAKRSDEEKAALIQFQIYAWLGKQPDEKTAMLICKIYGLRK